MARFSESPSVVITTALCSMAAACRLVARSAVQPGVATVFREIIRQGAGAACLRWHAVDTSLTGPYSSCREQFPAAVLLGLWRREGGANSGQGQLWLNPPERLQLMEGDMLLGLTRHGEPL
jgi:hypothetical protein